MNNKGKLCTLSILKNKKEKVFYSSLVGPPPPSPPSAVGLLSQQPSYTLHLVPAKQLFNQPANCT